MLIKHWACTCQAVFRHTASALPRTVSVQIVAKDSLASITSVHHLINGSLLWNTQLPRHNCVNNEDRPLDLRRCYEPTVLCLCRMLFCSFPKAEIIWAETRTQKFPSKTKCPIKSVGSLFPLTVFPLPRVTRRFFRSMVRRAKGSPPRRQFQVTIADIRMALKSYRRACIGEAGFVYN